MKSKKILIFGLPGSGKTTLAKALAPMIRAVHWNADAVRANINTHLGFSEADREEQARRMSWLCDQVIASGHWAIADFVCPTHNTRDIFGHNSIRIWMNTIKESRFEDTNKLFMPPNPNEYDYIVTTLDANFWAKYIFEDIDIEHNSNWIRAMLKGL